MRIGFSIALALVFLGCSSNATLEPLDNESTPTVVSGATRNAPATSLPSTEVDWWSAPAPPPGRGVASAKSESSASGRSSPIGPYIPPNQYVSFGRYSLQKTKTPVFDDCALYTITTNPELERVEFLPAVLANEGAETIALEPGERVAESATGARLHPIPE